LGYSWLPALTNQLQYKFVVNFGWFAFCPPLVKLVIFLALDVYQGVAQNGSRIITDDTDKTKNKRKSVRICVYP
jgi:hypothetical protein